jgi:hypothetical protein
MVLASTPVVNGAHNAYSPDWRVRIGCCCAPRSSGDASSLLEGRSSGAPHPPQSFPRKTHGKSLGRRRPSLRPAPGANSELCSAATYAGKMCLPLRALHVTMNRCSFSSRHPCGNFGMPMQIESKEEAESLQVPLAQATDPTADLLDRRARADLAKQFYKTEHGDLVDRAFCEDTDGVLPDVDAAVSTDWVALEQLAADAALGPLGARVVDPRQVCALLSASTAVSAASSPPPPLPPPPLQPSSFAFTSARGSASIGKRLYAPLWLAFAGRGTGRLLAFRRHDVCGLQGKPDKVHACTCVRMPAAKLCETPTTCVCAGF